MRHGNGLKKLGRTSTHRRALLRNLATSLFRHEKFETTVEKAKALKPVAEKLITLARTDSLESRRRAYAYITDKTIVQKLFSDIAPRYKTRPGGYTRIFKLGNRAGDAANMALIELVGNE